MSHCTQGEKTERTEEESECSSAGSEPSVTTISEHQYSLNAFLQHGLAQGGHETTFPGKAVLPASMIYTELIRHVPHAQRMAASYAYLSRNSMCLEQSHAHPNREATCCTLPAACHHVCIHKSVAHSQTWRVAQPTATGRILASCSWSLAVVSDRIRR